MLWDLPARANVPALRAMEVRGMPKAVMLDVDGTLVDSVALHAVVRMDVSHDFGHEVGFNDVRGQIGRGGGRLPPVFLLEEDVERRAFSTMDPATP